LRKVLFLLALNILTAYGSYAQQTRFPFPRCSPTKVFKPLPHTYKIAEKDLLEEIMNEARRVDWIAIDKKVREKILKYTPPTSFYLAEAKEHKVRYFDPTWYLPFDVKDAYGNVLWKKGTAINPLEKIPEAVWKKKVIIFLNLKDKYQRQFALNYIKNHKDKNVVLIADKHSNLKDVVDFIKKYGYFSVYSLTKQVAERFGVDKTLSVVTFVRKNGKPVVRIEEFPEKELKRLVEGENESG